MTLCYRLAFSLVATAWLVAVAQSVQCAPADYTFHQIARSDETFDPFGFEAPVLNNEGAVAFNATRPTGQSGIFRGFGSALATIALEDGFSRFGSPSINPLGHVGFEASLRNIRGEGIFRGNRDMITKIAATRDAGDFDFVNARPSINASRLVAFIGERIVNNNFIDGVYVGDGGPVAAIYDTRGVFADFTGNPSLNDFGEAAFLATLDTGGGGLFLGSGGEVTTVADETGIFTSVFGFSDPSLNERGEVAFRAGTNVETRGTTRGRQAREFLFLPTVTWPPSCRGVSAISPAWATLR